MFTLAACDATIRAARLAGFDQAQLLQEPIAAGLAYGFNAAEAGGYFLVYDLGGGTFDTSLMTIRDGALQVIDHAGDEYLGGKNFDDLLLDFVVDCLRKDYAIRGLVRSGGPSPQRRRLYAKLKRTCELAKIDLSRLESTAVEVSEVSDDSDRPIDTYVEVTRSTYESVIAGLVDKTTQIIGGLLERNKLRSTGVQGIIMVGGPTLTPFIRDRVAQATGITMETRLDPMTMVAQGACIFAASIPMPKSASTVSPGPKAMARIDLRYSPVTGDTETLVGGRIEEQIPPGYGVEIQRSDAGWLSGRVPVVNGTFVVSVVLRPRQTNNFRLRLFDERGSPVSVGPEEFAITHGLAADEPPLSRSVGIAVEDADGNPRTLVLLRHGDRLPASRSYPVRTTRPVGPGEPGGINLHIVEGESDRADRNDHVGYIRLDGSNLARRLLAGSEVEVAVSVDTSRKLTVRAFVPMLDATFTIDVEDVNIPQPDINVLEAELLAEEGRLDEIADLATTGEALPQLREAKRAIEEARSGDDEAPFRAQRWLRELQTTLDGASASAELALQQAKWTELLPRTQNVLQEHGEPAELERLLSIVAEVEQALAAADVGKLSQRVEEAEKMYWATLFTQPGFWIGLYQDLVERSAEMTDRATARLLIQQGRQALDRQDFDALRQSCRRLWELLPSSARGGVRHGLPDVWVRA